MSWRTYRNRKSGFVTSSSTPTPIKPNPSSVWLSRKDAGIVGRRKGEPGHSRALERNCAAVAVQRMMESEVVTGDIVTGVTVEHDEEWDCTTALLTLRLKSKTLFVAYTTRGGPQIKPSEESVPIEAFLYGPALPLDLAKVVFSGTPLPEYRTFPSPIMYQSGFSFTMNSGELYNLIKQEKIIPITDGVAPLDELRLSAQAEIEKFLRRIQGEQEDAQDEPIADKRPEPGEPDERITLLDTRMERSKEGEIKAYVRIRNTTHKTLKLFFVTFMFESESGSLIATDTRVLELCMVKPDDVATSESIPMDANPEIDHFTVKFESEDKTIRYKRC